MSHSQGDKCFGGHYPHLALSGWMRSGTDSIANFLRPKGYYKGSFAFALKEEVARAAGVPVEAMSEEPLRTQIRPVLQAWGTEFRRAQDPDYWVKKVQRYFEVENRVERRPLVFTDCRFLNELKLLKSFDFITIKVDMKREDVEAYLMKQGKGHDEIQKLLGHPSEQEWQDYDFDCTVRSVMGDLEGLYAQVMSIIETRQA